MLGSFVKSAMKLAEVQEARADEAAEDGIRDEDRPANWEPQENVPFCRECDSKFDIKGKMFKHHCRECGGVFCQDCLVLDGGRKICLSCKRGETPGEYLMQQAQTKLDNDPARKQSKHKHKRIIEQNVTKLKNIVSIAKDGTELEEANAVALPAARRFRLRYGSLYGEDGHTTPAAGARNSTLPLSGYFEFLNKSSDEVCCVKLLRPGGDCLYEAARPSYIAVPPGVAVCGTFDHDVEFVDLLVLYQNNHPILASGPLYYDTNGRGIDKTKISASCKVSEFRKVHLCRIYCRGKNILLKYKGGTSVEPRNGNNIGRVGLVGWLQDRRFAPQRLDFSTNVTLIENFPLV